MNQQQEKFESLWSDFIALVKGKLLTTANKQTLSLSVANLILTDLWAIAQQGFLSMARIAEWVAMPSSRGSSQPRYLTQVSHIAVGFFTI